MTVQAKPGCCEEAALVRTDLEAPLAEALEAVEWGGPEILLSIGIGRQRSCPLCCGTENVGHAPDCKVLLALKAFRGEAG